MKNLLTSLVLVLATTGCWSEPTPRSVQVTSEAQPQLQRRISFLEQYLSFRRSYQQLEYSIQYRNGGDDFLLPSPSEWDIKVLAVVPKEEIPDWISEMQELAEAPSLEWLSDIPGEISPDGITAWYHDGGRTVGVDPVNAIIAYRNLGKT